MNKRMRYNKVVYFTVSANEEETPDIFVYRQYFSPLTVQKDAIVHKTLYMEFSSARQLAMQLALTTASLSELLNTRMVISACRHYNKCTGQRQIK